MAAPACGRAYCWLPRSSPPGESPARPVGSCTFPSTSVPSCPPASEPCGGEDKRRKQALSIAFVLVLAAMAIVVIRHNQAATAAQRTIAASTQLTSQSVALGARMAAGTSPRRAVTGRCGGSRLRRCQGNRRARRTAARKGASEATAPNGRPRAPSSGHPRRSAFPQLPEPARVASPRRPAWRASGAP